MEDRVGRTAVPAVTSRTLPKESRLAKRAEFRRTYEAGRKSSSRYCVMFVAENELAHCRMGITATRKLGKANVRNRVKRWVREIFRHQRIPLGLNERAVDFVVNLKQSAAEATFHDFSRDLTALLRRLASGSR